MKTYLYLISLFGDTGLATVVTYIKFFSLRQYFVSFQYKKQLNAFKLQRNNLGILEHVTKFHISTLRKCGMAGNQNG
jgi:hypothetical protein